MAVGGRTQRFRCHWGNLIVCFFSCGPQCPNNYVCPSPEGLNNEGFSPKVRIWLILYFQIKTILHTVANTWLIF